MLSFKDLQNAELCHADIPTLPTASWSGTSLNWHGVIKLGRKTVWTCTHEHRDRNHGAWSAWHCAAEVLRVAQMPIDEAVAYSRRDPRSPAILARCSVRAALNLDAEVAADSCAE